MIDIPSCVHHEYHRIANDAGKDERHDCENFNRVQSTHVKGYIDAGQDARYTPNSDMNP